MIQVIKYKCCDAIFAACVEPDCYIEENWLKDLKQYVKQGYRVEMVENFKFKKCNCENTIDKKQFKALLKTHHINDQYLFCSSLPQQDFTIDVEIENFSYTAKNAYAGYPCGIEVLSTGRPVLYINCGGDSAFPVCGVVYWDKKLRIYFPKEGNVYDKQNNVPYKYQLDLINDVKPKLIRQEIETYFNNL